MSESFAKLSSEITGCRACARLVAWREQASSDGRQLGDPAEYWARPVPGFGDPKARLVLVGLAPAAHGANRTGRMFTGDRSGEFLFAALHRAGYASQPTSTGREDGLVLSDAFITAPVRCAPPDNKPSHDERLACAPFLRRELAELDKTRVLLALGAFALDALVRDGHVELANPKPRPHFAHGLELQAKGASGRVTVLCSYHPSQRNVFTGLLNAQMFDEILARARSLIKETGSG